MRQDRNARLLCIHVAKFSMEPQPQSAFLARHDLGRMLHQTLAHLVLQKRRNPFAATLRVVDQAQSERPMAQGYHSQTLLKSSIYDRARYRAHPFRLASIPYTPETP